VHYPLFDFLEYGNVVNYFQPDDTYARMELFNIEGYDYHCIVRLRPPNFRALIKYFPDEYTSREKGFKAKVSYKNTGDCSLIEVVSIHDPNGKKIWDLDSQVAQSIA